MSSPKFEFLDFSNTNENELEELIHLINEKSNEIDVPSPNASLDEEDKHTLCNELQEIKTASDGEEGDMNQEYGDFFTKSHADQAAAGLSFFIDGGTAEDIDLEKTPPFPSSIGTPSLCNDSTPSSPCIPDLDESQSEANIPVNIFNPSQPPFMNPPPPPPPPMVHSPMSNHALPSHHIYSAPTFSTTQSPNQSGNMPTGMYSHIPAGHPTHHPSAAAAFPHTVHIENCHVNLSPYGNHQHPASVYAHHAQPFQHPQLYQPYIMPDQSGSVPIHMKSNLEKDYEHKRSADTHNRGVHRGGGGARGSRGRGRRRARDDTERSSSVSSDHSSYSDSGSKVHYKDSGQPHPTGPAYPVMFRYPTYMPYVNHLSRSGYSMVPQSPHFYAEPYASQSTHLVHYPNPQQPTVSMTMIHPENSGMNFTSPPIPPNQEHTPPPPIPHNHSQESLHEQVPLSMEQQPQQISITTHASYLAHQSSACQFAYSNNENTVVIGAYATSTATVPGAAVPYSSPNVGSTSSFPVTEKSTIITDSSTSVNIDSVVKVTSKCSSVSITDPSTGHPVILNKFTGNSSLEPKKSDISSSSNRQGEVFQVSNSSPTENSVVVSEGLNHSSNIVTDNQDFIKDHEKTVSTHHKSDQSKFKSPNNSLAELKSEVVASIVHSKFKTVNVNKSKKKSSSPQICEFLHTGELNGEMSSLASTLSFMDPFDTEFDDCIVADIHPEIPKTSNKPLNSELSKIKLGKSKSSRVNSPPTVKETELNISQDGIQVDNSSNIEAKINEDSNNKVDCNEKCDSKVFSSESHATSSSSNALVTENLVPTTGKSCSKTEDNISSVKNNVKSINGTTELAWAQPKSWSHLFKSSSDFPNKQVAFVSPFNAKESVGDLNSKECPQVPNGDVTPVDKDSNKIKIGGQLKKYKPDYRSVHLQPRGLINKNYWCYANAPLQALLSCPSIYQLSKTLNKDAGNESGNISTPFINSFVDFANEFRPMSPVGGGKSRKEKANKKEPEIIPGSPFEPTCVYKMLMNAKENEFTEGRQQDAEEMLSCVLNGLHDEMVECLKLVGVSTLHQNGTAGKNEERTENDDNDSNQEEWKVQGPKKKSCITRTAHFHPSPISQIFWGQLRSVLQQGGSTTANLQPFNTLPLDIQSPTVDTLKDALSQLVTREEISGFTCPKTNQEITASNQVMLEDIPRVLILQLKRFIYKDGGLQKVTKKLEFPVDLEITKDLISVNSRGKFTASQRKYKLFAVVNHEGKEATKGHYVAYVFHGGYGCWLRYDDSSVKAIPEKLVLKHDPPRVPYLLFYRRTDTLSNSNNNNFNSSSNNINNNSFVSSKSNRV